ncbi:hydantoinase/oxoprolinase family protein [Ramlibacter sp. AW1]|uniref:Hydantoinase/oxoprolinase family protein n=1 Tax=Ramlibacter aurantiacus TaxID=2801330 RepID=A0A936ZS75_9BURK|nr:hydantoinase/oxoprolinase family protein [Ramlibacter aurantiacus]MBL0422701.1 hydantoinase/oxoprolinase family protein [Ramlibacter aurantiacus]
MNSIGVDIGGTFTDLVGWRDGELVISKTLTTPANPTEGVVTALKLAETRLGELDEFLHGSTIAINTVLERKGSATALVTTEGFRDVYEIARGNRPDAFDIHFQRPEPLVPRHLRFEARERLNARGEVLAPLDEDGLRAIAARLRELGIGAVAVCFLHAYANPAHEIAAGRILREAYPGLFVTLSHEILREFREYERTSTTVLNAYVGPRVARYLRTLESHLGEQGFGGAIQIMRSNGGSMSLAHASVEPVSMMESGPVAGMIGAGAVARLLGIRQAIGFDMGGTTAKATLITDGVPGIEEGYYIGGYATGHPMQLPVVAIVEVGTGGGSIAWRDGAGGLHVGPQSAGSDPGPVCYGRGGTEPTITDANVILGRLNPDRFLGGGMGLDLEAARRAMASRVGDPIGLSTEEAALGVVRIADSAMALAVRAVSVRKGVDPRDAAMIAFGGAGPVHAAALCKEIYIPTLVIPKLPGNFSALGMLLAPWRHDWVRTLVGVLGRLDGPQVQASFEELLAAAHKQLAADELDPARAVFELGADLRYKGQEHTIPVPVPSADALAGAHQVVTDTFHALHDMRYGHAAAGETIEVANLRLTVTVPREGDSVQDFLGQAFEPEAPRPEQTRPVICDDSGQPVPARILWRPGLPPGFTVEGPAVIEEPNSTTVIYPGDVARVTEHGHLVVSIHLPQGEGEAR